MAFVNMPELLNWALYMALHSSRMLCNGSDMLIVVKEMVVCFDMFPLCAGSKHLDAQAGRLVIRFALEHNEAN